MNSMNLLGWIDVDSMDWDDQTPTSNATELFEQIQDNIDWKVLSEIPNATELFEQIQDNIEWKTSFTVKLDYAAFREAKLGETECIAEYVNHPRFVEEFLRDHKVEELDSFEEWFLNRWVC